MSESVSDLLHLVEAIQAAKDNWNYFCWRLRVQADGVAFDLEIGDLTLTMRCCWIERYAGYCL